MPAVSPLQDRMIFAFGARRSGTWWLQRILTAHPEVSGIPSESYLFELGIRPLLERFHHGMKSSTTVAQMHADRDVLIDATRDFCDRILEPYLEPGTRYLSERSPGHAKAVDVIAQVYPDAKLIGIVRDGRDVARSLVARDWGPDSIGEAAREWRDSILIPRASAPAGQYLELRYESLLEDLESGIRGLYEWLGLPADDEIVQQTLAVAKRPINEDPKDPRITTNKWRDHFSDADLAAFEAEAGDLLDELGYERAAPTAPRAPDPQPAAAQPGASASGVLTRLRGRLARPEPAPAAPPPGQEIGGALAVAQKVADRVLEALHAGDATRLQEVLAPNATMQVIGGAEQQLAGAEDVAGALLADAAWRGTQLYGRAHPGDPTYTLVLGYEPDVWRVLCLQTRAQQVQSVVLYRLSA
jgi:hypothetical protein